MAEVRIDADGLKSHIDAIIASVDFTREGEERSIGLDMVHAVAEDITEFAAEQANPDGSPFPENEAEYAAMKEKRYGFPPPAFGYRTGQMLSMESVLGQVDVQPDEMTMKYGTGRPAARSSTGAELVEADKSLSDIEKAFILTRLAKKRIRFFAIGEHGRNMVMEIARNAVARLLGRR